MLEPAGAGAASKGLPLTQLTLGADRVPVSRLGLGTHGLHWLLSSGARQGLLGLAFDLGFRYFDTAPSYGNGLAEEAIGRFAARRRSDIIIATKFGIPVSRGVARLPGGVYAARAAGALARKLGAGRHGPQRDFSAGAARVSLEQSLRALRTGHVDILYLHEPSPAFLSDAEPLLGMLETLKASGKIRYIGLSGRQGPCEETAKRYPALAQVLQIEVPADAQGLPATESLQGAAAVRLWEFPARVNPPPPLQQVLLRLCSVAPDGVILLSTRDAAQLRDAARLIGSCDAHA